MLYFYRYTSERSLSSFNRSEKFMNTSVFNFIITNVRKSLDKTNIREYNTNRFTHKCVFNISHYAHKRG